jgi:hypothetical protein
MVQSAQDRTADNASRVFSAARDIGCVYRKLKLGRRSYGAGGEGGTLGAVQPLPMERPHVAIF